MNRANLGIDAVCDVAVGEMEGEAQWRVRYVGVQAGMCL
jgi:hypothetical protein